MKKKSILASLLLVSALTACNSTATKQENAEGGKDSVLQATQNNKPEVEGKVVFNVIPTLQLQDMKGKVKKIENFEDSHCGDVAESSMEFDEGGFIIKSESSLAGSHSTFTYQYDENHYLVSKSRVDCEGGEDQPAVVTQYKYSVDGDKLVQTATSPECKVATVNVFNAKGKLVSSTYGGETTVENTYNNEGQLLESKNEEGKTTRYQYDDKGLLVKITNPQATETLEYNKEGQLVKHNSGNGYFETYTYDNQGNWTRFENHNEKGDVVYSVDRKIAYY